MNYETILKLNAISKEFVEATYPKNAFKKCIEEDILEQIEKHVKAYNKALNKLTRLFCLKDTKTKEILTDKVGRYRFTEEGQNKLDDEHEVLLEKEIDFEKSQIHASDLPELEFFKKKIILEAFEIIEDVK